MVRLMFVEKEADGSFESEKFDRRVKKMFAGINEGGSKASALKSFASLLLRGRFFRRVSNNAAPLRRHGMFPGNLAAPWLEASSFHPNSLCRLPDLVHAVYILLASHLPILMRFTSRTLWQVEHIKAAFDQIPNVSVFSRVIMAAGDINSSLISKLSRACLRRWR